MLLQLTHTVSVPYQLQEMALNYLHQNLLSLLVLSTSCFIFIVSSSKVTCPQYCTCTISLGMRSAACTGQRLLNIDTDVPSNVEIFDLSNNSISSLEREGFKVTCYYYVCTVPTLLIQNYRI
jgi:hypothetical protein